MTTEATPGALGSNDQLGAWQPIETAPRDGRRVLVWIADSHTGHAFAKLWFYSTDGRLGGGAEGYNGDWNITHWMPLPSPPNERRERQ
jgi:hypothetical protein